MLSELILPTEMIERIFNQSEADKRDIARGSRKLPGEMVLQV